MREAPLQKVVLGVGFTTDSGPRLSVDHIHNQHAAARLARRLQALARPEHASRSAPSGTRSPTTRAGAGSTRRSCKSETSGSYDGRQRPRCAAAAARPATTSTAATSCSTTTRRTTASTPPPSASALSLNWGWTGRYFDNAGAPTRGHGLALELGAGYTLTGERLPFTRIYGRWLGIVPLGTADAPTARRRAAAASQLRAEAGAVIAKDSAQIPPTLMFLTGGDTTVRGYSYRQIGTVPARRPDRRRPLPRRSASIEWQRPFVYDGKLTDWESAVFVDAGAVADKPGELKAKVGVGVGARWRSPIGPVQADLAYGVDVKQVQAAPAPRLHLLNA